MYVSQRMYQKYMSPAERMKEKTGQLIITAIKQRKYKTFEIIRLRET